MVHMTGAGHGSNSQSGPDLPTELPSGQVLTSIVQADRPGVGQASNSQLGPSLPTKEPSGHSFTSAVQPTGDGHGLNSQFGPERPT